MRQVGRQGRRRVPVPRAVVQRLPEDSEARRDWVRRRTSDLLRHCALVTQHMQHASVRRRATRPTRIMLACSRQRDCAWERPAEIALQARRDWGLLWATLWGTLWGTLRVGQTDGEPPARVTDGLGAPATLDAANPQRFTAAHGCGCGGRSKLTVAEAVGDRVMHRCSAARRRALHCAIVRHALRVYWGYSMATQGTLWATGTTKPVGTRSCTSTSSSTSC